MNIKEILKLSFNQMTKEKNLQVLVEKYKEMGESVCLSCPGSLHHMIMALKRENNMSNFRIKNNGYYRLSKKSGKTINNNIITDELAIEFLQVNPDRINLFETYPENWEELVFPEDKEELVVPEDKEELVVPTPEPIVVEDKEEEAPVFHKIDEKEEYRKIKMYELRKIYPSIKETSKEDFITEILKLKQ